MHGCFAGTPESALQAVRDRLGDLAALEAYAPQHQPVEHRAQVRLRVRFLYGAVDRWYELSHLMPPSSLYAD